MTSYSMLSNCNSWKVEVDLKGMDSTGRVFDERIVKFEIGEGIDTMVPRGVEIGLEKMKVCMVIDMSPGF